MFKKLVLDTTLLCISICLLSACGLIKERMTTDEDAWMAIVKQRGEALKARDFADNQREIARLDPEKLALQSIPPDILIGKACNNNFNFEIKVTKGIAKNGNFILEGTLTGNSQSNLQFQTLVQGEFSANILTFLAFTNPSKRQEIGSLRDDSGLSRNLRLYLIKDSKEKGWEGTIEGEKFSACDDLTLISTTGKYASMFPSKNKLKAYDFSFVNRLKSSGFSIFDVEKSNVQRETINGPVVRLYWLKRAVVFDEAELHSIGEVYEELGKTAPENYSLALQAYHDTAKKIDSLGSYKALSRMYSLGLGIKADPIRSKKLSEFVESEIRTATGVCMSPEVIQAFKSKLQKISGTVIRKMEAGGLLNLNKQFSCVASIQRVNSDIYMNVKNMSDHEMVIDSSGRIYAYDRSMEKFGAGLTALAFDHLISKFTFQVEIKLVPLGGDRYTIAGEKQVSSFTSSYKRQLAENPENKYKDPVRTVGKFKKLTQESPTKQEFSRQKEQQTEQNPNIDEWAKDYFNKQ